jgi:hypothetical protein
VLPAADIAAHARDGAGWSERQVVDLATEVPVEPASGLPAISLGLVS